MTKAQTTKYTGVKKFYFDRVLKGIIIIGNLISSSKTILDFGCGEKRLEFLLKRKIYNYDVNPDYSEIKNYLSINFDLIVINHVLMYFTKTEVEHFFKEILKKNPNCEFVIGIGKQNFLSKILKNLSFNFNAHEGTILNYSEQLDIINKNLNIIRKKNIFFITDLFYAKFKKIN